MAQISASRGQTLLHVRLHTMLHALHSYSLQTGKSSVFTLWQKSSGNTCVQILNSMALRFYCYVHATTDFIMCFSIQMWAFPALFQFSLIPVTQSRTICLQVKVVSLNLRGESFSVQKHIISNMKHFVFFLLLLLLLQHHPLDSSSPFQKLHFSPFPCTWEIHLLRCYPPAPHLPAEQGNTLLTK